MIVKLPTEHHLEFLSLKGGCRGSSESTHVKMSNCWKPYALAQFFLYRTGFSRLFMLSYQWFGTVGILGTIVLGSIISLITGK